MGSPSLNSNDRHRERCNRGGNETAPQHRPATNSNTPNTHGCWRIPADTATSTDVKPARTLLACLAATAAFAACTTSTDSAGTDTTTTEAGENAPLEGVVYDGPRIVSVGADRELAGNVRTPAPNVAGLELPSLTNPGQTVDMQADPGKLQVVYFGFTNCPDVCPTTLADLTIALRKMPDTTSANIDVVMVTVDPDRDLDVLDGYVTSFIETAQAAGTDDAELLAAAAAPFGVTYNVTEDEDGNTDVSHTGFLYLTNDNGELVVSWPFGTSADMMAADMMTVASHS